MDSIGKYISTMSIELNSNGYKAVKDSDGTSVAVTAKGSQVFIRKAGDALVGVNVYRDSKLLMHMQFNPLNMTPRQAACILQHVLDVSEWEKES